MENGSKALIMAAEILIALLIISLGVYMFVNFGQSSRTIASNVYGNKRDAYNSHFLILDQRFDITAQEIATAINYAKENNDEYDLKYNETDSPYYMDVYVPIVKNVAGLTSVKVTSFFRDETLSATQNEKNYNDKNLFHNKVNSYIASNNLTYFSINIRKIEKENVTKGSGASAVTFINLRPTQIIETTDLSNSDIKVNQTSGRVTSIRFTYTSNYLPAGVDFRTITKDNFLINNGN